MTAKRKSKARPAKLPRLLVVHESGGATRLFLEDGTEIPAVISVSAWAMPGESPRLSFELGPVEFVHLPKVPPKPKGVRR